ncbi:hypothetical protein HZS_4850 [Henneguya salminicola]|nr:hypothetical protein HZS_4850 [Henneguya salminicola]
MAIDRNNFIMAKQKMPTCARCRNHGHTVLLKGHKNFCPYRSCACAKCYLLVQKQQIMATQIAIRRFQEQCEQSQNKNRD